MTVRSLVLRALACLLRHVVPTYRQDEGDEAAVVAADSASVAVVGILGYKSLADKVSGSGRKTKARERKRERERERACSLLLRCGRRVPATVVLLYSLLAGGVRVGVRGYVRCVRGCA